MRLARSIPLWVCWAIVIWLVCLPWPGMAPQANNEVQLVPFTGPADRPTDVIANLLLFLPFGFLFAAYYPRAPLWMLIAAAAAVSLAAEALQLVSAARFSSATDVVVNVCGAALGGWGWQRFGARVPAE